MNVNKQKNIASTVVFGILQLVLLFSNFSIAACISTGAIVIYWVVRNIINVSDEKYSDNPSVGNYVGLLIVNIMAVLFFNMIKAMTFQAFLTYGKKTAIAISIWLAVIAMFKIASTFTRKTGSVVNVIIKYIILTITDYIILNIFELTDFQYSIVVAVMFVLPFFLIDLYETVQYSRKNTSIFISGVLSLGIYFLICNVNSKYALSLLNYILKLNSVQTIKWYVVVIVALLFLALSIAHYFLTFSDETVENRFTELNCFLLMGYDFVCYALGIKYYTKYVPAFAVGLLLVNLIVLFCNNFKAKTESEDDYKYKLIFPILLEASLLFVYLGFVNGVVDIFAIAIISAFCIALFHEKRWISNLLIILCALFCCDVAYHYHNSKNIYFFVICLAFVISLILYTLSLRSKGLSNEKNTVLKYVICVVAFLTMITPFFHTGVKIAADMNNPIVDVDKVASSVVGENNNITVSLKPHGKNNKVTRCIYYWGSESDKAAQATLDENGCFTVEAKQDKLIVVCTDENGVISKYQHFFSLK